MRYILPAYILCTSFTASLASIHFGYGKQDDKWVTQQSGFSSEEEFKVEVEVGRPI